MLTLNFFSWRKQKECKERHAFGIKILIMASLLFVFTGIINMLVDRQITAQKIRNNYLLHEINLLMPKINLLNALNNRKRMITKQLNEFDQAKKSNRTLMMKVLKQEPLS